MTDTTDPAIRSEETQIGEHWEIWCRLRGSTNWVKRSPAITNVDELPEALAEWRAEKPGNEYAVRHIVTTVTDL